MLVRAGKRCFPRLRRVLLSLALPRESKQREGAPTVLPRLRRGALRCSTSRGGCGTRACGPQTVLADFPPARLRCSARQRARGKAPELYPHNVSAQVVFTSPLVERRATERLAEKGRGLSEPPSGEFRSPRQLRVAQGSRRSRPRNQGSPFLWLLSFGEAKESMPARKAERSV